MGTYVTQNITCPLSDADDSVALVTANIQGPPGESDRLALVSWGLPEPVLRRYKQLGIVSMFPWQAECLCTGNVLSK